MKPRAKIKTKEEKWMSEGQIFSVEDDIFTFSGSAGLLEHLHSFEVGIPESPRERSPKSRGYPGPKTSRQIQRTTLREDQDSRKEKWTKSKITQTEFLLSWKMQQIPKMESLMKWTD